MDLELLIHFHLFYFFSAVEVVVVCTCTGLRDVALESQPGEGQIPKRWSGGKNRKKPQKARAKKSVCLSSEEGGWGSPLLSHCMLACGSGNPGPRLGLEGKDRKEKKTRYDYEVPQRRKRLAKDQNLGQKQ